MKFNPDTTKQTQEAIFTRKLKKIHPPLLLDDVSVARTSSQNTEKFYLTISQSLATILKWCLEKLAKL